MDNLLNVIFVTKRQNDIWEKALNAIKSTPEVKLRILVVDTEKSFTEAVNKGLEKIKDKNGDVVIMHDDVIVSPFWYKKTQRHLEDDEGDIFGYKLVYPDLTTLQHMGSSFYKRASVNEMWFAHDYNKQPAHVSFLEKIRRPMSISHAFVYIKRKVINAIGKYDEAFKDGYYYDDVDFNFRVLQKGFRIASVPVPIVHYGSWTRKLDENREEKQIRNHKLFEKKWVKNKEFMDFIDEKYGFVLIDAHFNKYLIDEKWKLQR